jgi:hypothetical protein
MFSEPEKRFLMGAFQQIGLPSIEGVDFRGIKPHQMNRILETRAKKLGSAFDAARQAFKPTPQAVAVLTVESVRMF